MIARSLRWRLLLAAAGAIMLALALAWVFMTLLFERHLERRLEVELTRDALGLVADLAFDAQGRLALERQPVDARMDKPAGGYYWQVSSPAGVLRSRSLWDQVLTMPPPTHYPEQGYRVLQLRDNQGREAIARGQALTDAQILQMNWLAEGVQGQLPK